MVLRQVVSIGLGEGVANAKDGARHLTPAEWHAALVNIGGDGKSLGSASGAEPEVVLLDARNLYESRIGRCCPLTQRTSGLNHILVFPYYIPLPAREVERVYGARRFEAPGAVTVLPPIRQFTQFPR